MTHPLTGIFFFVLSIAAVSAVVAIFKMKFDAAGRVARQQAETDSSYRDLAAQALKAQEANGALLSTIDTRLASLERLLQDVA